MIALALRSLGERKLRTALTALAVLLGVAMIAGTYVQTDRIRGAFESLTQTVNRGTDVVVSPRESFSSDLGQPTKGLPETMLATVRRDARRPRRRGPADRQRRARDRRRGGLHRLRPVRRRLVDAASRSTPSATSRAGRRAGRATS